MTYDRAMRAAVFCGLVGLALAVRLMSETPNFNAVTAAALFAGFFFRSRTTAICVPLLAMAVSDLFLGGYEKHVMIAVYGSLLIPIAWRSMLRAELSVARKKGPALILDYGSTTLVPLGWHYHLDSAGNLLLQ